MHRAGFKTNLDGSLEGDIVGQFGPTYDKEAEVLSVGRPSSRLLARQKADGAFARWPDDRTHRKWVSARIVAPATDWQAYTRQHCPGSLQEKPALGDWSRFIRAAW